MMGKAIQCKKVYPKCKEIFFSDTEEDLIEKITKHAKERHELGDDADLRNNLKKYIEDEAKVRFWHPINFYHLSVAGGLALLASLSLIFSEPFFVSGCVAVGVNIYLLFVLLELTLRFDFSKRKVMFFIPMSTWYLLQVVLLTITTIFAFGNMYIKTGNVAAGEVKLIKKIDACYFSFVTLTTLGYGDFLPIREDARQLVIWELSTGFLLLIFALPLLISRITSVTLSR